MSRHKQSRQEKVRLPEVTRDGVLDFLRKSTQPASAREIVQALGLRHRGRRDLPKILSRLKRTGEIEEPRAGRFRLAGQKLKAEPGRENLARSGQAKEPGEELQPHAGRDPNLIEGRLLAHRDGYGFVVPAQAVPWMDGDLFIGRDQMGDAMHGDRVLARIERRGRDGRAEGRIIRVVNRAHPTVVGLFRYGPRGNVVLPYDTRLHHEIVIPPGEELTPELREKIGETAGLRTRLPELEGAVVNVELTRFPKGGVAPAGRVMEILGRPGEIGVDIEIIIRKHHLPSLFPDEALKVAHAIPQHVSETDLRGRRDFREPPIVTIDGETAKDFDDAVHVRWLENGNYELQVHIADVASYVRRDSPLDREARLRGTSVYFPGRAVPMLPEELSNGICSLRPQVDRLVMSALMEINPAGDVVRADFMPGVIRSAERMTYTNVNKVLEGDAEMLERYAALADEFRLMKELALLLNARRNQRGSIDFDLPERVIEFDEMGRMLSIGRSDRNIAHRIIEEFMLAANEAVASYLEHRGIASLHRVHEKPDPKKVLEFEGLAHAFGYSLGVEDLAERRVAVKHGKVKAAARGPHRGGHGRMRPMEVTLPAADEIEILPQHYQRLTRKIAGKPEERIVSYLMLRSLKQARYAVDPLGHFALATDEYTHFTSPIRRYPDLIVHRALKWALENPGAEAPHISFRGGGGRGDEDPPAAMLGPYRRKDLESIATESSDAERRADLAERELVDWKTAQYMEQHLGDEFDALIISVQKFGFFVELIEIFVEGLVPINHLEEATGERCIYREKDQAIVTARGRQSFHLGDRVRVRADRIDPFRLRVEFSLVAAE
ncbi:MAG: ribonuclease R family protein [Candidatus Acidiferrales bacterium]